MSILPIYIPSKIPVDITSSAYVRQNPWERIYDVINCVRISNQLQIPFTHVKETVDAFKSDPTTFMTTIPEKHHSQVKMCMRLSVGTIIIVPNKKKGLLVRIKSEVKSGILDSLYIACNPRNCYHIHLQNATSCEYCNQSIRYIGNTTDIHTFQSKLRDGYLIEPLYSLFYDVDILGDADYTGVDGRKIGGMSSVGERIRFWKVRV